ncbi:MAG: DctP family TRAP transporter solute-binding subunit [Clostridiales bacterium]|nr:DctP family TRAP transporter solute-binding subunit [Clostridiales bacterium]
MKKALAVALAATMIIASLTGCGGSSSTASTTAAAAADSGKESAAAEAPAGETYHWRMAHEEYDGDMQDVYCKEFIQKLNEKSGGRITVDLYPVGQLGDAIQQCELLQNNALEFAIISPGNTGSIVPENQLFSLHFLFPSDWNKTLEVLQTSEALNKDLAEKYLAKNIKVLQYWTEGAMWWTSNVSLKDPSAFKGLKFRTMQSPMIIAAYEAYGANPTPMSYTEVYSGLQLKMIEGQENPTSAILTSKFYEVQKYLTDAQSNLYMTCTCVNPTFYDGLPDDIKAIIDETIAEMYPRSFEIQDELNGAAVEKMQSLNPDLIVEALTDEERAAYKELAPKAYEEYGKIVGDEGRAILDKLLEEVAAIEAK